MMKHLLITALFFVAFHSNADELYVPKKLKNAKNPDLVVMLHGCKTTAVEFAMGTRMNALADKYGFIVFYPEQTPAANSDRCWNWFLSFNQARGFGEPAQIMASALNVKNKYRAGRIFVAGMSAGGAMAAILASTYADEISGVAIHSGLSYLAAFTVDQANWALVNGSITPPQKSSTVAYQGSLYPHRPMPTLVFHGDADVRVYPKNSEDVIQHFAMFNDYIDDRALNGSFNAKSTSYKVYNPPNRQYHPFAIYNYQNLMSKVIVHGMAHAWSGGNPAFVRNDPYGPDASTLIVQFFRLN